MPGSVIGISMNLGFPGTYSRNGDSIVFSRVVKSTDTAGPAFGDPCVLNGDSTGGSYSSVAQFIAGGGVLTTALVAGTAVREVRSSTTFGPGAPAITSYNPGDQCDVLLRGSASVLCRVGTPTAGGKVYIRTALNGGIAAGLVGGFEASADGGNSLLIPNMQWTTGLIDGNGVAEITMLSRNVA